MTKENTMQPFVAGDIFLGLTLLNDPDDDHAGDGRIVQYGADLQKKGELWTEGGHHFVGGLECDNSGVLWAFNDLEVLHVDSKTGQQLPLTDKFLPRGYRSASFDSAGNVYLGEHMKAVKKPNNPIADRTTIKFPEIPGEGVLGYGYLYKYDSDWNLLKTFATECAPEMTQFKGVTHSSLHPDEQFITYATETGKRLMQYDVVNDKQLPDLVTYPDGEGHEREWVIAVKYMADGRLLITRGDSMELLDDDGNVVREYPLETYGWSDIETCGDGIHCLVSNIWEGTVAKVHIDSGAIVGVIDTGMKAPNRCLAGIAEYKG